MARRRVCGYAAKVTRKNTAGEVTETTYITCTLPEDGQQLHERHEVHDRNGTVIAWWVRGVDFEWREVAT